MGSRPPEVMDLEVGQGLRGCVALAATVAVFVAVEWGASHPGLVGELEANVLSFAGLAAVLACVAFNGRRYRLTPDGLEVHRWVGRRRRFSWSELRSRRMGRHSLSVRASDGCVHRLTDTTGRWRKLAAELDQRPELASTTKSPELSAEQIEDWLGVEPGGHLTTGRPAYTSYAWAFVLAGAGAFLLLFRLNRNAGMAVWLGTMLAAMVGFIHDGLAGTPVVDASAAGLTIHRQRRRFVPWTRVLGFNSSYGRRTADGLPSSRDSLMDKCSVVTTEDTIELNQRCPHGRQIALTVNRVLAAMDRGELPAPPTEAPDAAISLHRLTEPEAERGISVVRGESDDA